jgi:hypothetical protein
LRFLVRDGGEEPPLDAGLHLRVVQEAAILRQRAGDAIAEHAGVDALDVAPPEIALGVARERAVRAQAREEPVDGGAQLRLTRRDGPCELAPRSDGKRDVEIEVDVAHRRGIGRCDDRVADLAFGYLRDQGVVTRGLERLPVHFRMRRAHGGDRRFEAGVSGIRDRDALQVLPGLRLEAAAVVDENGLDRMVAVGPQHARRGLRAGVLTRRCALEQAARTDMRLAAAHLAHERRCAVCHHDDQRELLLACEALDQVVVEARWQTVAAREPRGGSGTNDDDERVALGRWCRRLFGAAPVEQQRHGACEKRRVPPCAVTPSSGIGGSHESPSTN